MSDLWLPPEKPKQEIPKELPNGILEIEDEEQRKEVGKLLARLMNLSCIRDSGINLPGDGTKQIKYSRRELCQSVARQLLGRELEFEVLC